jgi:hypothetical protein
MIGKAYSQNQEKETIRRSLLATMLCSANTSPLKGSHGSWGNFWQGWFKRTRML